VAKAGYVETPSRLEEQTVGIQGPWAGWGHHRWLVEEEAGRLAFAFKHHVMHARPEDHFPLGFWELLSPEDKVLRFWWEGRFAATERLFGSADDLDSYLADFVTRETAARHYVPRPQPPAGLLRRTRRKLASRLS
jgi:hypothetical protein